MTEKLWEVLLVHPDARGPLAQLSSILWRTAGSVLARQPKDYGLDKRKMWEPADLDAPVPKYFVTQLKYVRGVLALGNFQLFERVEGAEPLSPLCLETPTLAIGRGHPLLRETQSRVLWFQIARQVSSLRPAFMLPRTLGAQRFNMLVEMAIRLVEPRYPVHGDPKEIAEMDKALARVAQPLANALQPVVAELMKARQLVSTKPFLEGMEHTAIRTAYLLTGDLDLCVALLRQPDPGAIPLAFGAKLKELLLFATSDDHLELRQRLGLAVGAPGAGG